MKGLRTHAMQIGGAFEFDIGKLKLSPALHGSATPNAAMQVWLPECSSAPKVFASTIAETQESFWI
jgi:hypothetical protein